MRSVPLQGLQKKQPVAAPKVVDAEKAVALEEKQPLVPGGDSKAVARKEAA